MSPVANAGVQLNDQVICSDLLNSAKAGIKSYASALTETATPQVRDVLRRQFDDAVNCHEKLTNFMMNKGWYQPYNIQQQIQKDIQTASSFIR
jgi:similar to spore coat protein